MRSKPWVLALALLITAPLARAAAQEPNSAGTVLVSVRNDTTTVPLRDVAREAFVFPRRYEVRPMRIFPHVTVNVSEPHPDSALRPPKTSPRGALEIAAAKMVAGPRIEGLGEGFKGMKVGTAPPDANGAAGKDQYVQWVNTSFAVFDKAKAAKGDAAGAVLLGPANGNAIWKGFGGSCEDGNDGDAIVQYDKIANRWVLSQFSIRSGGFYQCVAVSTTADATGCFHRYAFAYDALPDYPKMGIWPDAYYVSFNMYVGEGRGLPYLGAKACAFDRSAMLEGKVAREVCIQLGPASSTLLPADLDGATASLVNRDGSSGPNAPPRGTPNFFVGLGDPDRGELNVWKFHVDWNDPRKATFGLGNGHLPNYPVTVPPFVFACNGTGAACVPQPAYPTPLPLPMALDTLGDRLMFRLAYRRFPDHEALVLTHSVDTGSGNTGIRWYELRSVDGADFSMFQASTFAPDGSHRWMGSIAMDKLGDILVGYNVGGAIFPGLRYTWRTPADELGILRAEEVFTNGSGSQQCRLPDGTCRAECGQTDPDTGEPTCDPGTRWGDYSSMTVDPVDDCMLWYTGEYQKVTGARNWNTQIGSFRYSGCK
jgi:hypothetical protein